MLFGLYDAAITLCAVLVEFSLKHAIVRKTTALYMKKQNGFILKIWSWDPQ
jgi:hypothetical protein